MQRLLLLLALIATATACTNNHPATTATAAATAASPATSDDGDAPPPATVSLTIDGQTVTGTTASHLMNNWGATDIDPDNKPEFRFILADIKDPDGKPTRTVMFQAPIKVGAHQVDCSGDDHYYGLEITFEDDHSDQYCAEKVTLNVTEVSDTRVKGNFSGNFNLIGRPRQKTIKADCTFDIPRPK
jgi:hypothetical protein